ncbi:4-oxalocrotonate tautomerase family protein [Opitutaceae bacterium]
MPYVNVQITKGGVTAAHKRKIVQDITRSLVTTLGKKPEHIHIVIDEIAPENWGFAGMLTTDYRAAQAKTSTGRKTRRTSSRSRSSR